MPLYEEISHITLFIYHPDYKSKAGESRNCLTQTVDLMPTFLDLYGLKHPPEVEGKSLLKTLESDTSIRDYLMFGYWGGGINITDGKYTYFCYPKDMKNQDLYQYTLMPMHMTKMFTPEELKGASLAGPFDFTKGVQLLRVPHKSKADTKTHSYHFPEAMEDTETVIYDLEKDPGQTTPITDQKIISKFNDALFILMKENDAPAEAIKRMHDSVG
jgi:hypothetical protein